MSETQTILLMILAHLITDFTLQGWLADGKQKLWWHSMSEKYRYDYIAALVCHALYWAIAICLPIWNSPMLAYAVISNTIIHGIVDDLKANRKKLNLIQDQLLHLTQIVVTAIVF